MVVKYCLCTIGGFLSTVLNGDAVGTKVNVHHRQDGCSSGVVVKRGSTAHVHLFFIGSSCPCTFFYTRLPVAEHLKFQVNIMNACQRRWRYMCQHYQPGHVTPRHPLLVLVCIFILTTDHSNSIKQWHGYPRQMTFSHSPLALTFLNNVLPAMVLQSRVVGMKIGCTFSFHPVRHVLPSLGLSVPSGLKRAVIVGMVVILLLLLSGDIEVNPGPLSELYPIVHGSGM